MIYSSRNFTPFEQTYVKRLFPFYSFSSRVMPTIVKEMAGNPGGALGKVVRAQRLSQRSDEMAPDYVRESASIPLKSPGEGIDRYLTGFGLMHEAPFSFGPNPKNLLLELGSRMNPLVKTPLEFMTGQSFFQKGPGGGRKLDDMDPLIGRLAANVGLADENRPQVLPPWMEHIVANSPAARGLSSLRQLTDTRKGAGAKLMNLLSGIRINDISPAAKESIARELLQREMKDSGARTFERIHFPAAELDRMPEKDRVQAMKLQSVAKYLADLARQRSADRE